MTWCARRIWILIPALVLLSISSLGQDLPPLPHNPRVPTIVFTLVNWKQNPRYYSIALTSTGNATYISLPNSVERTGVPYSAEFPATSPTRQKIFDLAQSLGFFRKPLPGAVRTTAGQKSLKTLAYHYAQEDYSFSYHKPGNSRIQQLTALFEKISASLEFGRQLRNLQQSNPHGLNKELRRMRAATKKGKLLELQAITPILREISVDNTLSPKTRQQARGLLGHYGSGGL